MKKLTRAVKNTISHIMHFIVYAFVSFVFLLACFAMYVKINPLDISFLIDKLKDEKVLIKEAEVKSLYLIFDKSFILKASDISVKSEYANVYLKNANMRLARASIFTATPSFREIHIENADIYVDLDKVLEAKQVETKKDKDIHSTLKNYSYLTILNLTKNVDVTNSHVAIKYNESTQELNDINIQLRKTRSNLDFTSEGTYTINGHQTPISLDMSIPDNSELIDMTLELDSLHVKETLDSIIKLDTFAIDGLGNVKVNAQLDSNNHFKNITGSAKLQNGFVKIDNVYDNKLTFETANVDFDFDPDNKFVKFYNGSLTDTQNIKFNVFGDLTYKAEPLFNITVTTDKAKLDDVFTYIPDMSFKPWVTQHLFKADVSNFLFGYYGPFRQIMDGENGNPYFDIRADFNDLSMYYMDGIPKVEQAKGNFRMLKNDIIIEIEKAKHSEQSVKRASVKLSPLFKYDEDLMINVKALSTGSVEDALNVVNTKLDLQQDELFKHYKGLQETQTDIKLNLAKLINDKDNFIEVDVISDISEIVGMDPVFKQRFEATDSILKITEEDFVLDASGFLNENPFTIKLEEKLLEFGQHTKINVTSNFDSFLLKQYVQIPSLNLSGLVFGDLELYKEGSKWNFDVDANLENNLVNFGLLNYTKPYSKPGILNAKGYFDIDKNILDLQSSKIDIDDFKANGKARVLIDDLAASTADFKNIIIKDKTKLDEFSLKSNVLNLTGDSLDIRPFTMAKSTSTTDINNDEQANKEKQSIKKLNIRLKRMYLNDDEGLLDVTILLNLEHTFTGIIKALDKANTQNFYLRLSPDEKDKNKVKVESLIPNFGNALRKTKMFDDVNSGFGIIFGDLYFENGKFDFADLKLNVKKFQLLKAPLLAQALASISLEQLLTKKEGILFDDLYVEIRYEDGILKLNNGKVKGPSLGLILNGAYDNKTKTSDLKGTIIPVVKLNSVLSNIPVLGYILTGSQGAISGADFKIYGTGKQKISVSPLSIVTPGIVKDVFDSVYSSVSSSSGESKAIKKARKKANIESKK
jgi:hypothetical protein